MGSAQRFSVVLSDEQLEDLKVLTADDPSVQITVQNNDVEYRWVVTKEIKRWKGFLGGRHSETVTYHSAKRNARRRTKQKGLVKPRNTITEEWRLVDKKTGQVLD